MWACEHLHLYVYGKPVTIYTDYKPLVSIYSNPSSKPCPKSREIDIKTSAVPDHSQVSERRSQPRRLPIAAPNQACSRDKLTAESGRGVRQLPCNYLNSHIPEAIAKGNWHLVVKHRCVDVEEFRLLERVKDELTVSSSGHLILRGTRLVIPESLHEHVVNLAH